MLGKRIFLAVILLVALLSSPVLYADLLAGWDVNGVDVSGGSGIDDAAFPYTKNATELGVNISGGALALGFDGPSSTANTYGFRFLAGTHQTSLGDAIVSSHYIEFTVAASAGYQFDLASIEMNGESGDSGPDNIALMSDVDGFLAGNEIASLTGLQGVTGGWDTDASGWGAPIDLSGSQYQGLAAVTFRIYGWNSSGATSSGIRNLSGNDLVVNGTVKAIPEPAVIALISMFGVGVLITRRVKK